MRGPNPAEYSKPGDDPCYYETAVLPQQLSAVTGACILARRSAFDDVSGLDEGFPVDYNDIDFCMRLRELGYKVVLQPRAKLYHYESVSRGKEKGDAQWISLTRSLGRYAGRWGKYFIEGDPFYDKNFKFNDLYHRLDW